MNETVRYHRYQPGERGRYYMLAALITIALLGGLWALGTFKDAHTLDDHPKVKISFNDADCDSLRFMQENPGSGVMADALAREIKERC